MNMLDASVPPGFCLALYKGTREGPAGLLNKLTRFIDRGPYSHTELLFSNRLSGSSSNPDGGVRVKQINYSKVGNWDFLPIPDSTGILEAGAWDWHALHNGKKYDIMGNVRFVTNLVKDSPDKWFCSKANLAALGIPESYRYGPNGAASILQYMFNTKIIHI